MTCDELFEFHSDFKAHMQVTHNESRPYKCNKCDNCYPIRGTLICHIEKKHENKKNYECDVCHKQFYGKSDWMNHCRIHSGEKPYECCKCHKAFTQSSARNTHQKTCKEESNINGHERLI
eukprot:UN12116